MRHALGGAFASLALLALPAAASAEVAPPYKLSKGTSGVLIAAPTVDSSTLAVQVHHTAAGLEFEPGAASAPDNLGECSTSALKTTCPDLLFSNELRLEGPVLHVDVELHGVSTGTVRLIGGTGSDSMIVDGPAAPNLITQVVVDPGTGNDSVEIGGEVNGVTLANGGTSPAPDPGGDDSFVIHSTRATIGGTLDAGIGDDVLTSVAPNLTLRGGAGTDSVSGAGPLFGDAGDDVLRPSTTGKQADGGDDTDTLSYRLFSTGLGLTMSGPTTVTVGSDLQPKVNVERLEGSAGNDTITGAAAHADILLGGQGDDAIDGRGGGDVIDGGPGFNTVTYANSSGPVTVDLGAGSAGTSPLDSVTNIRGVITGAGNDTVTGTSADERFTLGSGDDSLNAGAGNDIADGGAGSDNLRGGQGSDNLDGGLGTDTTTYDERGASEPVNVSLATLGGDGGAGENDTLQNIEAVVGGASNDTLSGDDLPNVLFGGPGVNTLDGKGGDDQLFGGDGRDVIIGGPGSDGLYGAGDDDSLSAADPAKPDVDIVSCGESLDDDAQVDGSDTVTDCEYSSRGDVPVPVDEDQDGFIGGFDCDDHDPSRNQAATDIPGDGIDQDCDGLDTPIPFLEFLLRGGLDKPKGKNRGIKFTRFVVTQLESSATVRLTCTSPKRQKTGRCPFRQATRKPKPGGSQVSFTALFKGRRLAPRTKVEFRVTAPHFNGRARRITILTADIRSQDFCIVAPSTTLRKCAPGDEL